MFGAALTGGLGVASAVVAGTVAYGAIKGASSLLGGPAKSTAPPAAVSAPLAVAPTAVSPVQPVNTNRGSSLASQSPGLALSGTAGFLGSSRNSGGKTLLGQ